jgi:Icc-related predicted phosphoesterase
MAGLRDFMRILAVSDIHEEEAALESILRLAPSYDHVFICGDISRTASFAEDALKIENAFIIPGNWDNKIVNEVLSKSKQWLHERRADIGDGLNAVGFGYSPPTPFFTYGELSEDEIYLRMSKLPIDGNTLLLTHAPPKGHFDNAPVGRHIGSASILKIIEQKKPLAAFFGHAHEALGVEVFNSTTLVKLPPASHMKGCRVEIQSKKMVSEYIPL